MRAVREYITQQLLADPTIKGIIVTNVFQGGGDQAQAFPCITILPTSGKDDLTVQFFDTCTYQIGIWAESSEGKPNVVVKPTPIVQTIETLADRVRTILSYQKVYTNPTHSSAFAPNVLIEYSVREQEKDDNDDTRPLVYKLLGYKFWVFISPIG